VHARDKPKGEHGKSNVHIRADVSKEADGKYGGGLQLEDREGCGGEAGKRAGRPDSL